MKQEFLDKVNLFRNNNNILLCRNAAKELKIIFNEYLKFNSFDTEIWMKFALMLYLSSLNENLGGIRCLEKILSYDSNNIHAFLIIIYINQHEDIVDKTLFTKLLNLKTDDNSLMSLIEYSKSWYYLTHDNLYEYEKSLISSIGLCNKYLWNYVDLGQFYIKKGHLVKGYDLIKKGLANLEYVYDNVHRSDILNIEEFFNERFKGVHLSDANYEIILESFDPKSPWITGDFISEREDTLASD